MRIQTSSSSYICNLRIYQSLASEIWPKWDIRKQDPYPSYNGTYQSLRNEKWPKDDIRKARAEPPI